MGKRVKAKAPNGGCTGLSMRATIFCSSLSRNGTPVVQKQKGNLRTLLVTGSVASIHRYSSDLYLAMVLHVAVARIEASTGMR